MRHPQEDPVSHGVIALGCFGSPALPHALSSERLSPAGDYLTPHPTGPRRTATPPHRASGDGNSPRPTSRRTSTRPTRAPPRPPADQRPIRLPYGRDERGLGRTAGRWRGATRCGLGGQGPLDAPEQPDQGPDHAAAHGKGRDPVPPPVHAAVGRADQHGVHRPGNGTQRQRRRQPNHSANDLCQHDSPPVPISGRPARTLAPLNPHRSPPTQSGCREGEVPVCREWRATGLRGRGKSRAPGARAAAGLSLHGPGWVDCWPAGQKSCPRASPARRALLPGCTERASFSCLTAEARAVFSDCLGSKGDRTPPVPSPRHGACVTPPRGACCEVGARWRDRLPASARRTLSRRSGPLVIGRRQGDQRRDIFSTAGGVAVGHRKGGVWRTRHR